MSEDKQLPAKPAVPPFELTVPKTNVTQESIKALQEKYRELPEVTDEGGLAKLKEGRREVKAVRIDAKAYAENIKSQIQDIKKIIDDAYTKEVDTPIRELEARFDEKIKAEEKRLAEIKAEKKRKAEERKRDIDSRIECIKSVVHVLNISSTKVKDVEIHIKDLHNFEVTKDIFDDRCNEVDFAIEITLDRLDKLKADIIKRDEEKAELAKREKELADKKRVDEIQHRLLELNDYVSQAAFAENLKDLEKIKDIVIDIYITKDLYEEFLDQAHKKKAQVLHKICDLINNKTAEIKKEEEAKKEKQKIEEEKAKLKKKEDDIKAREKAVEDKIKQEEKVEEQKKQPLPTIPKNVKPPPMKPGKIEKVPNHIPEKETSANECYVYLTELFDESTAGIFFEHLEAGKIPHLKAPWF